MIAIKFKLTKNNIYKRMKQHRHGINEENRKSALCQHANDLEHTFQLDNPTIIDKEKNY